MPYRIRWPDGSTTSGDSPADLLRRIGQLQWEPRTPEQIGRILADRAYAWSGSLADEYEPPDVFLRQLADAGMFEIVDWPSI